MGPIIFGGLMLLAIIGFFTLVSLFPFGTFIKCVSAGLKVSPTELIAMKLRKVDTDRLVNVYLKGSKGGLHLSLGQIEAHFLSGGDVDNVVDAMISAARAQLDLPFPKAAAIDLAGRDVLDAVKMRVQPRVLACRDIAGVAKNGIEVVANAKITVRANLDTMVGGAGEATILARVAEKIVSAMGSSDSHSVILNNPDILTKKIMGSGLDAGTAFEILSLDISDIDVGRNIGAILQNDQAEADKKVAQAKAEGRRAIAVAQMRENKAMEQEMKAKLVEAEMRVPHALADSFRAGKLLIKRKPKGTFGGPGPDGLPPSPVKPSLGFGADIG